MYYKNVIVVVSTLALIVREVDLECEGSTERGSDIMKHLTARGAVQIRAMLTYERVGLCHQS